MANLLVAGNGSGKSNFLESFYYLAWGKSFRPMLEARDVIGPEENFSQITVYVEGEELQNITSNHLHRLQRKFLINGKQRPISIVRSKIPQILFAPHSVDIVAGDPSTRRDDLDDFLSFAVPGYYQTLSKYHKLLSNRNALLKHIRDHHADPQELSFWTQSLVVEAEKLVKSRVDLFSQIDAFVQATAPQVYKPGYENFNLLYQPFRTNLAHYADSLATLFVQNQEKEIIVGQTLYGPHKDDYALEVNGHNLRYIGSRGEQRLAVLIWKLAQAAYLETQIHLSPVLLIDDLMSELDQGHREHVGKYLLEQNCQFVITAADKQDVPSILLQKSSAIKLS